MIWEVEQIRGGRWHRPGHHDETVILWSKSSIPAVRSSISSLKQTILKLYYTGCRTSKMALEMGTFTFINAVKCLRKSDFILIKVHSWRFTHFLFFFFFKVTIQTIKNYFFLVQLNLYTGNVYEAAPVISLSPWCNACEDYNQEVFYCFTVCVRLFTQVAMLPASWSHRYDIQ